MYDVGDLVKYNTGYMMGVYYGIVIQIKEDGNLFIKLFYNGVHDKFCITKSPTDELIKVDTLEIINYLIEQKKNKEDYINFLKKEIEKTEKGINTINDIMYRNFQFKQDINIDKNKDVYQSTARSYYVVEPEKNTLMISQYF